MKRWKIFLLLALVILALEIRFVRADNNTGSMANTSSLQVGSLAGSIDISGYASPGAVVFFIENGQVIGTTQADNASFFDKVLGGLTPTIHTIGVYATDVDSVNTITTNYSLNVVTDQTTFLSGLILPPSFSVGSSAVNRPAEMIGSGRSLNNASVQVFVSGSRDSIAMSVSTNSGGLWSLNLNPKLHLGQKNAYAMALNGQGGQSGLSATQEFTVLRSSDLNVDGSVNLTDFSILMYSYSSDPINNVIADINDDEVVDLVDFSIMMSNWSR